MKKDPVTFEQKMGCLIFIVMALVGSGIAVAMFLMGVFN
jgi:hypothetical protein